MADRIKVLRTYRFIDKDPVKDACQTMLQDEKLFGIKNMGKLAELASLNRATLVNLFYGHTRKPQNATVEALVRAVGYERKIVKVRKLNFEEELEFARKWNERQRKRLEGQRKKPRTKKTKKRAA